MARRARHHWQYLNRGRKLTRCPWLAENVWQQLSWRARVVFNLSQKRALLNGKYVRLTRLHEAFLALRRLASRIRQNRQFSFAVYSTE
jgi:hypothetical protein